MSDAACSFGCPCNLRERHAGVIEKGSTRKSQFDAASGTHQKLGTYLLLKVSNLPTQRGL
jgi:hypothetical protein